MTKTAKEPRVNFTVRLPWALRQRVHTAAHLAGQSVNEWMVEAITRKSGGVTNKPGLRSDEVAAVLLPGKSNAPD